MDLSAFHSERYNGRNSKALSMPRYRSLDSHENKRGIEARIRYFCLTVVWVLRFGISTDRASIAMPSFVIFFCLESKRMHAVQKWGKDLVKAQNTFNKLSCRVESIP